MNGKLSRNPVVDFTPMKNESVLFQSQTNQFCLLNVTSTFVWSELAQPRTVSDLANALCNQFHGVTSADVIRDVERIADELLSLNCLALSDYDEGLVEEKQKQEPSSIASESKPKPKYQTPQIKVMTENEVLSAFQVTAGGTMMWWV
jgi:hypothetical protein